MFIIFIKPSSCITIAIAMFAPLAPITVANPLSTQCTCIMSAFLPVAQKLKRILIRISDTELFLNVYSPSMKPYSSAYKENCVLVLASVN